MDIAYPTGLYSIDLVKPIRSGVSGSLVKPLFVDNSRRQFVGFADFVIHPGVGFDVVELMPIGFPDSDLVLDCSFAAENYHLENLIIKIPKQEIVYVPSQ